MTNELNTKSKDLSAARELVRRLSPAALWSFQKKQEEKMENKNRLAIGLDIAKSRGYKYVASVVKSIGYSVYHHVVPIADIGQKWPAAPYVTFASGARGRWGVLRLPDATIMRQELLYLARLAGTY